MNDSNRSGLDLASVADDITYQPHSWLGMVFLLSFGSCLVVIHAFHLFVDWNEPIMTRVIGCLVPMVVVVGVVVASVWLWYGEFPDRYVFRVAIWTAFGALFLLAGVALMIRYQQMEGGQITDGSFMMTNALSGGGLLGFLVGVHDSRQCVARARATTARSQVEARSNQISVLTRVLRHDIRNLVTVIQGRAEMIDEQYPQTGDDIQVVLRKADELATLSDCTSAV